MHKAHWRPCGCSGRADYFGNLPNLAARVSALAAPGQILLEGSGLGLDDLSLPTREDSVVVLPPLSGAPPPPPPPPFCRRCRSRGCAGTADPAVVPSPMVNWMRRHACRQQEVVFARICHPSCATCHLAARAPPRWWQLTLPHRCRRRGLGCGDGIGHCGRLGAQPVQLDAAGAGAAGRLRRQLRRRGRRGPRPAQVSRSVYAKGAPILSPPFNKT